MKCFASDKQIMYKNGGGEAEINKEKIIQTIQNNKVNKVGAVTISGASLCSDASPGYPVQVRDESKKSQTQFRCFSHDTKYADINKKKVELFSPENKRSVSPRMMSPSRPVSPAVRSIGDQTARAALIRTLITERLNSCSPIHWQTSS